MLEKFHGWSGDPDGMMAGAMLDDILTNACVSWFGAPHELPMPPRTWGARSFNVQRWTAMTSGGHFAALEEPEALAADIRAFFRLLRYRP